MWHAGRCLSWTLPWLLLLLPLQLSWQPLLRPATAAPSVGLRLACWVLLLLAGAA
jgi:hypothetical protein